MKQQYAWMSSRDNNDWSIDDCGTPLKQNFSTLPPHWPSDNANNFIPAWMKSKRRVRFPKRGTSSLTYSTSVSIMSAIEDEPMAFHELPSFLSRNPHIIDQFSTATSELQARTINECLPLLTAINSAASNPFDFDSRGLPFLSRNDHVGFLRHGLGPLPSGFVAMDASRPWLMYWSLMSFHLLGVDTKQFRTRYGSKLVDSLLILTVFSKLSSLFKINLEDSEAAKDIVPILLAHTQSSLQLPSRKMKHCTTSLTEQLFTIGLADSNIPVVAFKFVKEERLIQEVHTAHS